MKYHGNSFQELSVCFMEVHFFKVVHTMHFGSMYTVSEKDCTLFLFFFLGAQCVESGVSCTDCY